MIAVLILNQASRSFDIGILNWFNVKVSSKEDLAPDTKTIETILSELIPKDERITQSVERISEMEQSIRELRHSYSGTESNENSELNTDIVELKDRFDSFSKKIANDFSDHQELIASLKQNSAELEKLLRSNSSRIDFISANIPGNNSEETRILETEASKEFNANPTEESGVQSINDQSTVELMYSSAKVKTADMQIIDELGLSYEITDEGSTYSSDYIVLIFSKFSPGIFGKLGTGGYDDRYFIQFKGDEKMGFTGNYIFRWVGHSSGFHEVEIYHFDSDESLGLAFEFTKEANSVRYYNPDIDISFLDKQLVVRDRLKSKILLSNTYTNEGEVFTIKDEGDNSYLILMDSISDRGEAPAAKGRIALIENTK
ncbi:hypothetical protein MLD52_22180 [Puniceicoccaceae bacterium K14]|nr:hypothetical protein [Puniceicoccaceae bacterium K14]